MHAITGVPDGGYSSFAVIAQGRGSTRSATRLAPSPARFGVGCAYCSPSLPSRSLAAIYDCVKSRRFQSVSESLVIELRYKRDYAFRRGTISNRLMFGCLVNGRPSARWISNSANRPPCTKSNAHIGVPSVSTPSKSATIAISTCP